MVNPRSQLWNAAQIFGHQPILTNYKLINETNSNFIQLAKAQCDTLRDQQMSGTCYAQAGLTSLEVEGKNAAKKRLGPSEIDPVFPPLSSAYQVYWIEIIKGEDYLMDIQEVLRDMANDIFRIELVVDPTKMNMQQEMNTKYDQLKRLYKQKPYTYPLLLQAMNTRPGDDGGFFQLFIRSVEKYGVAFEKQIPTSAQDLNTTFLQQQLNHHWWAYARKMINAFLKRDPQKATLTNTLERIKSKALQEAQQLLYYFLTPNVALPAPFTADKKKLMSDKELLPFPVTVANNTLETPRDIINFIFEKYNTTRLTEHFVVLVNDPGHASEKTPLVPLRSSKEERLPRCCRGMPRIAVTPTLLMNITEQEFKQGHSLWAAIDCKQQLLADKGVGIGHNHIFNINNAIALDEHIGAPNDFLTLLEEDPAFIRNYNLCPANHAVILNGIGVLGTKGECPTAAPPEKIILTMQNSWGPTIGKCGEFYLYYNWLKCFLEEVVVLRDTLEAIDTLKPYSIDAVIESAINYQKEEETPEKLPHTFELLINGQ